MEQTTGENIVKLLNNLEPDYNQLDDDEIIAILKTLVAMVNAAAFFLGGRHFWVFFQSRNRSQFPRLHEPQAIEADIWQKVE